MNWWICFILAVASLAGSAVMAVQAARKPRKSGTARPMNILFAGVLVTTFISMLPLYREIIGETAEHGLKTVLFSLHNTFQFFTIDADKDIILNSIHSPSPVLNNAYAVLLSLELILGPMMTFGFVVSFFRNVSARLRYLLHWNAEVFAFSELNEQSLALARDLHAHHPKAVLVFTGLAGEDNPEKEDLETEARMLRAICFNSDILPMNLTLHAATAQLTVFVIGKDKSRNTETGLKLAERYKDHGNVRLYVFDDSAESEMLLSKCAGKKVRVRRVDEIRSLIYRLLEEDDGRLFDEAGEPGEDGLRPIHAVIVGLGRQGTEMMKALAWYGQMDGFSLSIDAYDQDKRAEDIFTALCPELMSPKYNGVRVPNEAAYSLRIHSDTDVRTASFLKSIAEIRDASYVLVSLGTDEMNIRTAAALRTQFERMRIHPRIQAVVYSPDRKEALEGITNYRGQPYGIEFVGDLNSSFSESVILGSDLEAEALKAHMQWGKEEEFWQYEYNYRSSCATALHRRARIHCGLQKANQPEESMTEAEKDAVQRLEHRRWNAYMRSEGYVFSGSADKKSRNDLGKMHHDLVDYEALTEEEKRKDILVATGKNAGI